MHNYTTIIGVIELRPDQKSYGTVLKRYRIVRSGITLIMNRFKNSGLSLDDFRQMSPEKVVDLIYPQNNLRHKNIPMPDFEKICCGQAFYLKPNHATLHQIKKRHSINDSRDRAAILLVGLPQLNHTLQLSILILRQYAAILYNLCQCHVSFHQSFSFSSFLCAINPDPSILLLINAAPFV